MYSFARVILITLLITTITHANEIDLVRYIDSKEFPDPKQSYFVDLLKLTLEASKDQFGEYQLQPINIEMAQARSSLMLQRNEYIDLTWRMTSQQLEQQLQAVYFPILKGLMGSRIFIISKDQQYRFNKNIPLADLQNLHLGQGYNWPDTRILLANGFNVIQGHDNFLIDMLKKGRFNYYPRALHEPWPEIASDNTLIVEENLMLKYPAPVFFFVNKENKHLQKRLAFGLSKLLESGRFEHFFINHPITSGIVTKANVSKRTIFHLENPLLSKKTKKLLADERLWIKLK
ncbi:hypothetical protein [Colwellia psychrerythraea]|uniref:Solute-binding protein family 3/N-terminal domain-containing protein n=1 Tax=Colwellia psychrerythraea TaxID=28229 RepID=A0A099KLL5_COLPS|nr:hypothetical protein [Colwellia psychrerythraea]KGJ90857.1 hypothetical protein GAB14E_0521 [Colwellia psychrerythraea]